MTSVTRDTESALTKNRPAVDASESLVTTRSSAINGPHHLASRSSETWNSKSAADRLPSKSKSTPGASPDTMDQQYLRNTRGQVLDPTGTCGTTRTVHLHVFRPTCSRQFGTHTDRAPCNDGREVPSKVQAVRYRSNFVGCQDRLRPRVSSRALDTELNPEDQDEHSTYMPLKMSRARFTNTGACRRASPTSRTT